MSRFIQHLTLFLLLLPGILPTRTFAQVDISGTPFIHNINYKDFKAGARIFDVQETPSGMLYAANKMGILEFDGVNWRLLKDERLSIVRSIAVLHERVYAAGMTAFGYFSYHENETVFTSLNDVLKEKYGASFNDIWQVSSVDDLLVLAGRKRIICLDSTMNIVAQKNFDAQVTRVTNYGKSIFISCGNALFRFQNGSFIRVAKLKEGDLSGFWGAFYHGDSLYIGINGQGIGAVENGTVKWVDSPLNEVVQTNNITDFLQLDGDRYAFCTFNHGLLIANLSNGSMQQIDTEAGLLHNCVLSINTDGQNNLWLGMLNGMAYVETNSRFAFLNTREGVGTGYSACLFDGSLYLGTNMGAYRVKTKPGGKIQFDKIESVMSHVWQFYAFDDRLYAGCPSGLIGLDKEGNTSRITRYPSGWAMTNLPGKPGYYLSASMRGLDLLQERPGQPLQVVRVLKTRNTRLRNVVAGPASQIWLQFRDATLQLAELTDGLDSLVVKADFPDIEGYEIRRVKSIEDEVLFFTSGGVFLYGEQGFFRHPYFKTVFGESPINLIEKHNDNYWVFSNSELAFLDGDRGEVDSLSFRFLNRLYPEGLENLMKVKNSVIAGLEDGFVIVRPQRETPSPGAPAALRAVRTMGKSGVRQLFGGTFHEADSGISMQIDQKLPFSENSLKFVMAPGSAAFNQPDLACMLEGFDETWNYLSGQTQKEYTNLPSGDYLFKVRKAEDTTGARVSTFKFSIGRPWYDSIVARIGYFLLMVGVLYVVRFMLHRRIRLERKKGEEEKERQLYEQEQERIRKQLVMDMQIVELKNEQLKTDIRNKSKELANNTMGMIKMNQTLIDIREQIQDVNGEAKGDVQLKKLVRNIDKEIDSDSNWKVFEENFDKVHENFIARVKKLHPELTANDIRLCSYLRMNLSSKEIAPLLNITIRGVELSRYRLRKKLALTRDVKLTDYILGI